MKKKIAEIILVCGLFTGGIIGYQQINDRIVEEVISQEFQIKFTELSEHNDTTQSTESGEIIESEELAKSGEISVSEEPAASEEATLSEELAGSEEATLSEELAGSREVTVSEEPAEPEAPAESAELTEFPETIKTGYIDSVFATPGWRGTHMSSVGHIAFPVFIVDFPDGLYDVLKLPEETLRDWIFTGDDSTAAFYDASSSHRLHMNGDIYYYTTQNSLSYYENAPDGIDGLVAEIVEYFDDEIDFGKYNKDGDIFTDSFVIAYPFWEDRMDPQFWCPSYHQISSSLIIADNTVVPNYIVMWGAYNDLSDNSIKEYVINMLKHELGHAFGLPDYYISNYDDHTLSEDGMPDPAGVELMNGIREEDFVRIGSHGEFSQFSKLQLGWLTWEQVQIMSADADRETFLLPPAAKGGCLLIFPEDKEPDFQSEYFLLEYITPDGEWAKYIRQGGVRLLHIQAKLNVLSNDYEHTSTNLITLVNGDDFYHTGDIITFESTGAEQGNFYWHGDKFNGDNVTAVNPGFSIQIGETQADNGYIQIEVIRNR